MSSSTLNFQVVWVVIVMTLIGPSAGCRRGDMRSVPGSCSIYQVCVQSSWMFKTCAPYQSYDPFTFSCRSTSDVECYGIRRPCREGHHLPAEGICDSYYICIDGKYQLKSCLPNLRYDPDTKACQFWWKVKCDDSLGRRVSDAFYTPCEEGKAEVNPENCSEYSLCTDGRWTKQVCKEGALFHPGDMVCREAENCFGRDSPPAATSGTQLGKLDFSKRSYDIWPNHRGGKRTAKRQDRPSWQSSPAVSRTAPGHQISSGVNKAAQPSEGSVAAAPVAHVPASPVSHAPASPVEDVPASPVAHVPTAPVAHMSSVPAVSMAAPPVVKPPAIPLSTSPPLKLAPVLPPRVVGTKVFNRQGIRPRALIVEEVKDSSLSTPSYHSYSYFSPTSSPYASSVTTESYKSSTSETSETSSSTESSSTDSSSSSSESTTQEIPESEDAESKEEKKGKRKSRGVDTEYDLPSVDYETNSE